MEGAFWDIHGRESHVRSEVRLRVIVVCITEYWAQRSGFCQVVYVTYNSCCTSMSVYIVVMCHSWLRKLGRSKGLVRSCVLSVLTIAYATFLSLYWPLANPLGGVIVSLGKWGWNNIIHIRN
ncbi:hypothetical protein STHE1630_00085 [Streptococcus thermophilus CNCM I-1630]|nr:hypothetical protein STHE1630_00085 [Streptococcus thermophilus CNCM I-1630]